MASEAKTSARRSKVTTISFMNKLNIGFLNGIDENILKCK
jgi:hypothetical protein